MRTLIREVKTGMYYGTGGEWTTEREDGRDFGGTFQAMSFAGEKQLRGVEVVLAFEQPEYDVVIHLERGQPPPTSYQEGTGSES